jgi:hypothetical protein
VDALRRTLHASAAQPPSWHLLYPPSRLPATLLISAVSVLFSFWPSQPPDSSLAATHCAPTTNRVVQRPKPSLSISAPPQALPSTSPAMPVPQPPVPLRLPAALPQPASAPALLQLPPPPHQPLVSQPTAFQLSTSLSHAPLASQAVLLSLPPHPAI